MARIRTIKPEFPQSESMGRVSRDARLTFIQLWTIADDSGRLRGSSRMLASLLFPYDDDAPGLIEGWLSELETEETIVRYKGKDGSSYLAILHWRDHQKIDKPSKSRYPEPNSRTVANPREPSDNVREHSSGDLGSRTKEGTKDQGPFVLSGAESVCPPTVDEKPPIEDDPPEVEDDFDPSACEFPDFPCAGGSNAERVWRATDKMLRDWRAAYPAVDIDDQHRRAHAWIMSNLAKRKTRTGMTKYLNRWFADHQNGKPIGPSNRPPKEKVVF